MKPCADYKVIFIWRSLPQQAVITTIVGLIIALLSSKHPPPPSPPNCKLLLKTVFLL